MSLSFYIEANTLRSVLETVQPIMAKTPLVPILDNLHFRVAGDYLTIDATNMRNHITVNIPLAPSDLQGSGDTAFFVDYHRLSAILRLVGNRTLKISGDDDRSVVFLETSAQDLKFLLPYEEKLIDFPKAFSMPLESEGVHINLKELHYHIDNTYSIASRDDNRPAMNCVCLNMWGMGLYTLTATDGHRLVRSVNGSGQWSQDVKYANRLIGLDTVALIRGIKASGTTLYLSLSKVDSIKHTVSWWAEGDRIEYRLAFRSIDERYPDTSQVIPVDAPGTKWAFDTRHFTQVLKMANLVANGNTRQAQLVGKGGTLTIATDNDFDKSSFRGRVNADVSGDDITIGVNTKRLAGMLKLPYLQKKVEMQVRLPHKPIVMRSEHEYGHTVGIIMPIMLSSLQDRL